MMPGLRVRARKTDAITRQGIGDRVQEQGMLVEVTGAAEFKLCYAREFQRGSADEDIA
jgi:hypothetical protein